MAEAPAALKAVDRLETTILVDNTIDVFLPSTAEIRRARIQQTCREEMRENFRRLLSKPVVLVWLLRSA